MTDSALLAELRDWLAFYEPVADCWLRAWARIPGFVVTFREDIPPRLRHLQPHDAAFILRCREIQKP